MITKLIFFLFLSFSLSITAFSQKNTKTVASCPNVAMQNVSLGITKAEAEKLIGKEMSLEDSSDLPKTEFKVSRFYPPKAQMVSLFFFQNKLYRISVIYDKSLQFFNIIDFTTLLSKNLGIRKTWKYPVRSLPMDAAELRCLNYNLFAIRISLDYTATLEDIKTSKLESDQKKELKEKSFKP